MTKTTTTEPLEPDGLPDPVSAETPSQTAVLRKCADAMNVSFTAVWRAKQIHTHGIPELGDAVYNDKITLTSAFWAATNLDHEGQHWLLEQGSKREISQWVATFKREIARQSAVPTHRCADCGSTNIDPIKTTRTQT